MGLFTKFQQTIEQRFNSIVSLQQTDLKADKKTTLLAMLNYFRKKKLKALLEEAGAISN